jgi:3-polyprenyl-4-hydroxybenzoate decarboxylase
MRRLIIGISGASGASGAVRSTETAGVEAMRSVIDP